MSWLCRSPPRLLQTSARVIRVTAVRRFSDSNDHADAIAKVNASKRRSVYYFVGVGLVSAGYLFWPETQSRAAPTKKDAPLSPSYFTPAIVTSSEPTGPNSKLIELTFPPHLLKHNLQDTSAFHPIWSIYIKDDAIQVERAYTPLEGIDKDGRMKFWIKRYPDGEVGRWIHSKKIGDSVEIRGPLTTWNWKENEWDHVIMISGGTGVTPFYQLLHHIFTKEPSIPHKTRFTLLHSSRAPDQLPPPTILQTLSTYFYTHPDRFSIRLFVDSLKSETGLKSKRNSLPENLPLSERRIGVPEIQEVLDQKSSQSGWTLFGAGRSDSTQRKVLFLVCGPDQMISAIAGPFGRNLSQGDVGGVLGEMGYKSEQVWKL